MLQRFQLILNYIIHVVKDESNDLPEQASAFIQLNQAALSETPNQVWC